jgi:hypothetical protein
VHHRQRVPHSYLRPAGFIERRGPYPHRVGGPSLCVLTGCQDRCMLYDGLCRASTRYQPPYVMSVAPVKPSRAASNRFRSLSVVIADAIICRFWVAGDRPGRIGVAVCTVQLSTVVSSLVSSIYVRLSSLVFRLRLLPQLGDVNGIPQTAIQLLKIRRSAVRPRPWPPLISGKRPSLGDLQLISVELTHQSCCLLPLIARRKQARRT